MAEDELDQIANYTCPNYNIGSNGKVIISASPAMLALFKKINQLTEITAQDLDINILISGESGTGKELIAQALHFNSKPVGNGSSYIPINCTSMPESLLESELFGHTKGAFTGAVATKKGLVEKANGGTLFLDEIGDMPKDMQAKILRMIQEREFRSVGSTETKIINLRLVTATHKDLEQLIKQGHFRDDLYYRINEFSLYVPPLRERTEDIAPLANYLLEIYNQRYSAQFESVSDSALDKLQAYGWPGNIRELGSVLKRVLMQKKAGIIEAADIDIAQDPKKRSVQSIKLRSEQPTSFMDGKWHEGGIYPITIGKLLSNQGTRNENTIKLYCAKNAEYILNIGERRSILFLTMQNIDHFFREKTTSYYSLLHKIANCPLNEIAKTPFAIYNLATLQSKPFIFSRKIRTISRQIDELGLYRLEMAPSIIAIPESHAYHFIHDKNDNTTIEQFKAEIRNQYANFIARRSN